MMIPAMFPGFMMPQKIVKTNVKIRKAQIAVRMILKTADAPTFAFLAAAPPIL